MERKQNFNLRLNTDRGAQMDYETSPTSTLRLSPFTPSLTASPTITPSSTASPSFFPEFLPGDVWLPADASPWLLSPNREHSPGVLLLAPDSESRPKKRPRHSSKLDREPVELVLSESRAQPAVVAIPPAQASDIPLDLAKKPPRKRPAASSRTKTSKRKASSPAPAPQPVRFRFVSVQHAETTEPDVPAEFEEHMEDEMEEGPFEHGPSELPPRRYPGGEYAVSPLQSPPKTGKIPASSLDFLPVLEARFARLENAIERYVEVRAQQALRNSILPELRPKTAPPNARPQTTPAMR